MKTTHIMDESNISQLQASPKPNSAAYFLYQYYRCIIWAQFDVSRETPASVVRLREISSIDVPSRWSAKNERFCLWNPKYVFSVDFPKQFLEDNLLKRIIFAPLSCINFR